MLAIDQKMDDGRPGTGYVANAIFFASGSNFVAGCDDYEGIKGATAKYLTDNNGDSCYIAVSKLNRVGDGGDPLQISFGDLRKGRYFIYPSVY